MRLRLKEPMDGSSDSNDKISLRLTVCIKILLHDGLYYVSMLQVLGMVWIQSMVCTLTNVPRVQCPSCSYETSRSFQDPKANEQARPSTTGRGSMLMFVFCVTSI